MNLRTLIKPFIFLLALSFSFEIISQSSPLPKGLTKDEKEMLKNGEYFPPNNSIRTSPLPPEVPVRTMAEWEELQAIVVTWAAYFPVVRDIVRYSKEEVKVINVCQDSNQIKSYLQSSGIDFENLIFLQEPFNTVWVRDYGPNPVYMNDVDSLALIDWIYNRPRPADDLIPESISETINAPLYTTTEFPNDLVHTGGNFMADGSGIGFSSDLILEENDANSSFGISDHSEDAIDSIMGNFMGIQSYPKFAALPYDGINHIDMHMKMLNENTILVGEFPEGVSDGPQIEENIQYLLDNYKTRSGQDFRIERIIQPPCNNGNYPPFCQGGSFSAEYRTYTNALFVNKTILVPIYLNQYDNEALALWEQLMPGYKIRGIDCRQIINAGGAIHCITKEIGVNEPLWIFHEELPDYSIETNTDDYQIEATIKHKSGIAKADLYWTTDTTEGYEVLPMSSIDEVNGTWFASIPFQNMSGTIHYYIEATSNSNKVITRPLVAPEGAYQFNVEAMSTNTLNDVSYDVKVFPNPARNHITIDANDHKVTSVNIYNTVGQLIREITGTSETIDVSTIASGLYTIHIELQNGSTFVEQIQIK